MKGSDFIRQSMTDFGIYVCEDRAMPHFKDGLKPCVRRVLYTYHKFFTGKDPKVADLAGRTMALHPHGNTSIEGAISLAAREWAGANNHRLFDPTGAVGTRSLPEKSAIAAARYLSVKGSDFLRDMFYNDCSEVWKEIPNYDEKYTEIESFHPCIPLCLINGESGVAYGYSVTILPRKITDIKNAIFKILRGLRPGLGTLQPHWRGFQGEVTQESESVWHTHGLHVEEKIQRKKRLVIKDIPIGITKGYILDSLTKIGIDYRDESDENFRIVCTPKRGVNIPVFKRAQHEKIRVVRGEEGLVSYDSVVDYLIEFVEWRLSVYEESRQYWIRYYQGKIHEATSKLWAIENNMFAMVLGQPAEAIIKILRDNNLHQCVLNIKVSETSKNNIDKLKLLISERQNKLKYWKERTAEEMYRGKLEDLCKKHGY